MPRRLLLAPTALVSKDAKQHAPMVSGSQHCPLDPPSNDKLLHVQPAESFDVPPPVDDCSSSLDSSNGQGEAASIALPEVEGPDVGLLQKPMQVSTSTKHPEESTANQDAPSSDVNCCGEVVGIVPIRKKRLLSVISNCATSQIPNEHRGADVVSTRMVAAKSEHAGEEACYKVTYTRNNHKKRPTFEDGVLLVRQGKASLYDSVGKQCMIGKCIRIDERLPSGRQLFGSATTMIEIDSEVSVDDFDSGRAFASASPPNSTAFALQFSKPTLSSAPPKNKRLCLSLQGSDGVARVPCEQVPVHTAPPLDAFMLAGDAQPCFFLERQISKHLRPHQEEGVRFMFKHVYAGLGCILADSMGLGKTLQALCLVWATLSCPATRPMCRKVAIVCPSSLCTNWEAEARKWLGKLRVRPVVIQGGSSASVATEQIRGFRCAGKMIIISYEQLRSHAHLLDDVIDLLVCDEGHRLKSSDASTTKVLDALRCKRRVLLTGTPLQNNLDEFWCCVNFVQPMLLPPLATFHRIYKKPVDRAQDKSASSREVALGNARSGELARLAKEVILRRGPELLETLLPSRTELLLTVPLTPAQVKMYRDLCSSRSTALVGSGRDASHLGLLTLLRQLCNMDPQDLRSHCATIAQGVAEGPGMEQGAPGLDENGDAGAVHQPAISEGARFCEQVLANSESSFCGGNTAGDASAKMILLKALLSWTQKEAPHDGVVIVSGYRQALQCCGGICSSLGLRSWTLTGATPVQTRLEQVNAFNDCRGCRVFLLSAKAGGVGLNIIGANRLIMLEPDWNPAVDLQAMGRIWRQGQTKPVFIYRFATHGTVEEKILQRQARKQDLASATLTLSDESEGGTTQGTMDWANLKDVFMLNGYNILTGAPCKCSDEEILPTPSCEVQQDAGISDVDVHSSLYSIGLLRQTTPAATRGTPTEKEPIANIPIGHQAAPAVMTKTMERDDLIDVPITAVSSIDDVMVPMSDALQIALGFL